MNAAGAVRVRFTGMAVDRDSVDAREVVLRCALAAKLRRDGSLRTRAVERAFRQVPRHLFVPEVDPDLAYRDVVLPTKLQAGEFVSASSQPSIMAVMLEQLALRRGHRVLEIGGGTGYNAALLAEIVGPRGQVTAVDIDDDLVTMAREHLLAAGYSRVVVVQGDGVLGRAESAPYDRIMATVAVGDIPRPWRQQLKAGGRLVLPLAIRGAMKSVAFRSSTRGELRSTSIRPAVFMPLRGASPLPIRDVRVGPDLGLFAWFPPDRAADTDRLWTILQRPSHDTPTGLVLSVAEFDAGLALWLRAHEPAVFTLRAEGALSETAPVPIFTRSPWAPPWVRERFTFGLFDENGVAVLAQTQGERPAEHGQAVELLVCHYGAHAEIAERLAACVQAWETAGRPSDDLLRIRVPADGTGDRLARHEALVPTPSARLVLTWAAGDAKHGPTPKDSNAPTPTIPAPA